MGVAAETRVLTRCGWVQGAASADGLVAIFKGIPYAEAPVGKLRWRAPQPIARWQGVRPAQAFGPRCIQPKRPGNSISYFEPEIQSEDCLYLNIWTSGPAQANRPVMLWIHGGAYSVDSGAVPLFDGEQLARAGVVLVTMNFRLGRLGFLAHPELSRESGHGASGNYGLMDNIAALDWIRENIGAFGGDPGCVTVFGQSTGSASVSLLMSSPLAKGLFHRAVGHSCARFGPPVESNSTGGGMQYLDTAERCGAAFARALGSATAMELRLRPAAEIQLWHPDDAAAPNQATDTTYPIIDGHLMPGEAHGIFSQGRQNDVPLLTGSNENEGATMRGTGSLESYLRASQKQFGELFPAFLELFPAQSDAQALDASRTAYAYQRFTWQSWTWAGLQARTGQAKAYYYRFARIPPLPCDAGFSENTVEKLGAFHGAEIPYVFRNLHTRHWPWTDADRRLSAQMSSYWLNFAANGDPNGENLPCWPAFEPGSVQAMTFANEARVKPVSDEARLRFFDAHFSGLRNRHRGRSKKLSNLPKVE